MKWLLLHTRAILVAAAGDDHDGGEEEVELEEETNSSVPFLFSCSVVRLLMVVSLLLSSLSEVSAILVAGGV